MLDKIIVILIFIIPATIYIVYNLNCYRNKKVVYLMNTSKNKALIVLDDKYYHIQLAHNLSTYIILIVAMLLFVPFAMDNNLFGYIILANAIISEIPRISIKIVSLNKGYAKIEVLG